MIAFCADCRTALRGTHVCDPHHRVVDLASEYGRDMLARSAFEPVFTEEPRGAKTWPALLSIFSHINIALILLLVGVVLTFTGRPFFGLIAGTSAVAVIAFGGGRAKKQHELMPSDRTDHRAVGARAEPPWAEAPQRVIGRIESAIEQPSPFGGTCAGWALETSLAGSGVMLRDGETSGMLLRLDDERALSVPAGMLRLARRAGSDNVDSDAVSAHVGSLASPKLIVWDEARAIVLHVGDRIELVATIVDRTEARYRQVDESALTTIDVPVVRRVS